MLAAHRNYPKVVELLLPYEQGLKDSEGHTAKWHANNSSEKGDYSQVRELLQNEGTERTHPPPNPAEMLKLSRENESLKKELASSKNAREEAEGKLSQMNREVASLQQQLENTTEEAKKQAKMYEDLQKTSEQNQTLMTHLEKENNNRQARIEELATENGFLRGQISSSKNDLDETKKLSQSDQEVISLKQQLDRANEEAKKQEKMYDDLQKALEQNRILIGHLFNEVTSLRRERDEARSNERALRDSIIQQNALLITTLIDTLKTNRALESMTWDSFLEPAIKQEVQPVLR